MATRIEPTDIEPAYLAIGRVSVNWAYIEFELDRCMFVIYDRCDFKELKKDCPINFRRKLKIFKLAFRADPRLSALTSNASEIASAMSRFANYRNNTLHGTIAKFNRSHVVFDSHRFRERAPKPVRRTVPVTEIEKAGQEMEEFAFDLECFTTMFRQALRR